MVRASVHDSYRPLIPHRSGALCDRCRCSTIRDLRVHLILYSEDPTADRAFFRDVFGWDTVDAGDGWLIFALPPTEAAVHPSDRSDTEL